MINAGESTPDVLVKNEGTIVLFHPATVEAREWIEENVSDDAQWYGNALVVEHRYAVDLWQAMGRDGLLMAIA